MLEEPITHPGLSAQAQVGLDALIANALQAELSYRKQRLHRIREEAAREQGRIEALMQWGIPDYYAVQAV